MECDFESAEGSLGEAEGWRKEEVSFEIVAEGDPMAV